MFVYKSWKNIHQKVNKNYLWVLSTPTLFHLIFNYYQMLPSMVKYNCRVLFSSLYFYIVYNFLNEYMLLLEAENKFSKI